MAQVNVEKLDKKQLRELADKYNVKWDKRVDDSDSLKKKLRVVFDAAAEAEAKESTDFDITKRSPTETATDPVSKKQVKRPVACFGWYYAPIFDPNNKPMVKLCTTECPHSKKCKAFTESAGKALKELEAEEEVETEAEAVTEEDAKLASEASKERSGKKKGDTTLTKGEKRKAALDEDDLLVVGYDLDWTLSEEDPELRKFYKRIVKAHAEGEKVKVSELLDVLCEVTGIDDRDAVLSEMLPEMIASETFKRA